MRLKETSKKGFIRSTLLIAIAITGTSFYAHHQTSQASPAVATMAAAAQAMPVTVSVVKTEPVQIWNHFSARTAAVDFAEIRPQVSGKITDIRFVDGQQVTRGDILYVIDTRPFAAAVEQAQAEYNAARNASLHASKEYQRAQDLIKSKAISKTIYDQRENDALIAKTAVQAAQARLNHARINFDHAHIKAPISGRISRAEITQGNLVEAGPNAPVLTSIVSSAGIYADFDVDESTYLTYIRSVAKNADAEKNIPVKLTLGRGKYQYEGYIHSFDNRINPSSGTIRARAFFANDDSALLPGMFGKIALGSAHLQQHILVSETAIGTNQDRKFVFVVSDSNQVTYREVSLGGSLNGQRIITKGLQDGDAVIVEGLIRMRPGMLVAPQPAKPALASVSLVAEKTAAPTTAATQAL